MNKVQTTLFTVLICLACLAGWFYYQKLQKRGRYSATTKFQILQNSAPDLRSNRDMWETRSTGGNWMENQIATLSSPALLTRVVKSLNLEMEWHLTEEEALERVQERIEVTREEKTEIVSVTAWSNNAHEAAHLANGVRQAYEKIRTEAEVERFRRLVKTVEAEIESQQKTVEANQAEMHALQKKHGITSDNPGEAPSPGHSEYNAGKQKYEASAMLLSTMRELSARQKVDEGVVKRPVEVLEEARPPAP